MTTWLSRFAHIFDVCATHFVALFLVILAVSEPSLAHEPLRPKKPSELNQDGLTVEDGIPVAGARVAWVNYALVRRDFPQIAHFSDLQINEWLIKNFVYVGARQHELSGVRTTPYREDITRPKKKIYRPKEWIRSGVIEALTDAGEVIGMVDVKGLGLGGQSGGHMNMTIEEQVEKLQKAIAEGDQEAIDRLRKAAYTNGVMSFGEGVAEVTRQQAVQKLIEYRNIELETVEMYALISWDIGIMKEGGSSIPGAICLRQANRDRGASLPVPSDLYMDLEGNWQRTISNSIVDMGPVEVTDPLVHERFGADPGVRFRGQNSRPWQWGHDVALAFLRGDIDVVYRHVREMLGPVLMNLPQINPAREQRRAKAERVARALLTKNASLEEIAKEFVVPLSVLALTARDPNPEARRRAIWRLHKRFEAGTVEILKSVVNDPDKYVRDEVASSLSRRSDPESLEILKKLLLDSELDVRNRAIGNLVDLPHAQGVEIAQWAFDNATESNVRRKSIQPLAGFYDPQSLRLYKRALTDSADEVRGAAEYYISKFEGEVRFQLIAILLRSRHENMRYAVSRHLSLVPAGERLAMAEITKDYRLKKAILESLPNKCVLLIQ